MYQLLAESTVILDRHFFGGLFGMLCEDSEGDNTQHAFNVQFLSTDE